MWVLHFLHLLGPLRLAKYEGFLLFIITILNLSFSQQLQQLQQYKITLQWYQNYQFKLDGKSKTEFLTISKTVYILYIRSLLEYCSVMWHWMLAAEQSNNNSMLGEAWRLWHCPRVMWPTKSYQQEGWRMPEIFLFFKSQIWRTKLLTP